MTKYNSLKETYCPLLKKAYGECYVATGMSLDTWKIIHFCKKNYEICEIYKKHAFKYAEAGKEGI